jgi:hypothetical protein
VFRGLGDYVATPTTIAELANAAAAFGLLILERIAVENRMLGAILRRN